MRAPKNSLTNQPPFAAGSVKLGFFSPDASTSAVFVSGSKWRTRPPYDSLRIRPSAVTRMPWTPWNSPSASRVPPRIRTRVVCSLPKTFSLP